MTDLTGRPVRLLAVPTGPAVLDLLPALRAALDGSGPALVPVPAGGPPSPTVAALDDSPLAPGEDDPTDPTALVVTTSGSTGAAKAVLLPAVALAASAAATHTRLGGPGDWLLALPAHHVAGLQVLLRAAATGTGVHVLDTAEPFTAARFAEAAARLAAGAAPRRYVSLVPTQLHRVLADPAATEAATTFDAVLVGGAAAPAGLLARARAAGVVVVTTYGMTETCGGCVYDGRPLDGVTAEVERSGRLALTGPVVARGYLGRPGDPAFPRPGRFVTGDLGQIEADGSVSVLGRADEIIVTGGENVAPQRVEAALAGLAGVAEVVVVGVPDPEWGEAVVAVITTTDVVAPGLAELRRAARDLPPAHRPRALVVLDSLPRLGPGKADRAATRALAGARLAAAAPGGVGRSGSSVTAD